MSSTVVSREAEPIGPWITEMDGRGVRLFGSELEPPGSARTVRGTGEEWGRITAALIHQTGDWDLAEECAQDAFASRASPGSTSTWRT